MTGDGWTRRTLAVRPGRASKGAMGNIWQRVFISRTFLFGPMSHQATGAKRRILCVIATLVALALALPPLATLSAAAQQEPPAITWGPDVKLSNATQIADDPVVALTGDGGTVVAWREHWVARYSIFFTMLDPGGRTILNRTQLGADIPSCMDPTVAVDSRGRPVFVWTGEDDQELYYARTGLDGRMEAGPIRLTNATGDSAEASTWVDRRDHVHVVWFDAREGRYSLYYMQLDPDGRKVVEDRKLVQALTEEECDIAMDARGDIHVAWNAIAPAGELQYNTAIHFTKLSGTGEVLVRDRLVATSRGSIGYPDIAVDLIGNVHVAWPEGSLALERLMYAELDSSGRTLAGPKQVAPVGQGGARDVTVAVDGNDRLQVVWSEGLQASSELYWCAMAPGGDPLGDPVRLTDSRGDSRDPELALSPRGEPRVVWADSRAAVAEIYLKVGTRPVEGIDLAVDAAGLSFDPQTPSAGEEVTARVVVRSDGASSAPATTVRVSVNGSQRGEVAVRALSPGESQEVEVALGALAQGSYVVTAQVDPADGVNETDETNNVASRTLVVHQAGLLVADAGPDQSATAGSTVYLDASGTVYRGQGLLSYAWAFGDSAPTGSGPYVEHVYASPGTYTVRVTVSDGTADDEDTCLVRVAPRDDPPHAVIAPAGPLTADRLTDVELGALSSTDDSPTWPAGAGFDWDLGDGTSVQGAMATHRYARLGIFVVTLTVTDTAGNIDVNRTTVSVVNLPPVATLAKDRFEISAGGKVALSVQSSDPDGTVVETWWDFDASDGILPQTSGMSVEHTYDRKGVYSVTCVVRDSDGGQTTLTAEVRVAQREETPLPGGLSALALAAAAAIAASLTAARVRGRQRLPRR